jgi:ribosomal-protein-alanine N-acetyltransferase
MKNLATPHLALDPVTSRNAGLLWRLMQAAHLREYQDVPRFTKEEFDQRVAQRPKRFHARAIGRFEWLVTLADSRVAIGWVSLRIGEATRGAAEVGYSLLAPYRGKGYALEATRAVIDEGFNSSELVKIDACCLPENMSSRRLLDRLGFTQVKTQRNGAVVRGRAVDIVVYELTRERWNERYEGSANSIVMPASRKPK